MVQLAKVEKGILAECEEIIERGLENFIEVGNALLRIRNEKLYREQFDDFQTYCSLKWGMNRAHAYRMIEAAEVANSLGINKNLSPIGDTAVSESVLRPLAALPAPVQREAWKEAVSTAKKNGKPTAEEVTLVVEKLTRVEQPILEGMVSDLSELSGQKFGTIYADPPWSYTNQATRAATSNHYESMTVDALCEMPIGDLAAEKCHLHLWTTNAFLFDCARLFEAWGFEFKSTFVWVKPQIGIGNYWRNAHEILLLAIKGGQRAISRSERSWIESPRGIHSAKPEQARQSIEKLSPGPYLELFGRSPRKGWTVFGDQSVPELAQV